ncbi:hypothetical protein CDL12_22752 [Handroanthus impetiginosus]|uniref:Uncharacterized protein n=1 Tax=Handroanthus impetiginosus TaxID=429701 RepID=A0A2G9G4T0_9LAMI|nr:hypothetical protein CDL12_27297 [Handroanthus impetiginosus]PIN04711.1 hypothetical protein CDL12_22752 [Handroanthus impetiginosus]
MALELLRWNSVAFYEFVHFLLDLVISSLVIWILEIYNPSKICPFYWILLCRCIPILCNFFVTIYHK